MSSEAVNDENRGVLPVRKHVLSESGADIFALDQPTGRPSILRQSQVENLNKNISKGVKVCFQTPLRDPVTKKIMSPSRVDRMATLEDCTNALESLKLKSPSPPTQPIGSFPDDDMPIQSRGGYTIDFDNLDSVNPFQTSNNTMLSPPKPAVLLSDVCAEPTLPASSPAPEEVGQVSEEPDMGLDETLPFIPSVENSLADFSADGASTDSTVIIEPRKSALAEVAVDVEVPESTPVVVEADLPLPPTTSYQIDFDHLDLVDPFKTSGSKIQNSPPVSRKLPLTNLSPSAEMCSGVKNSKAPNEHDEPSTMEKLNLTEVNSESDAPSAAPPKDAPMLLEFNFDDCTEVKRKPPPKRLGLKKPPLSKSKTEAEKPAPAPPEKKSPEAKPEPRDVPSDSTETHVPPARGAYSIDFDQFDDPNFNPFGTKAIMGTSPPRHAPEVKISTSPAQKGNQEIPVESATHSFSSEPEKVAEAETSVKTTTEEPELFPKTHEPHIADVPKPQKVEEPAFPCSADFDGTSADDEFVPGSMFMPSDLDGQIDYLEQFGSSNFKESALRKQSLYLKFDPLLKESPKKTAVDFSSAGFSLPRPSLAFRMMEAARSEVRQKTQKDDTQLLEDFPPPAESPAVQDPTVLDLLVPTLKQTQRSEAVIVDMLQYTQKDLDSALEKARKQAEEGEADLKAQIEKMTLDNQHMVLIVSEFEAVIAQITAEHKQKEELAQAELSRVLQEKQQLAKELSDMERSFSDVVKRLDRRKEVIDGFKKNEETLKQCAQSYLARLQKEEQRYQMLKSHAEEKIDQANKQIAEVRTKMGAEVSALQVQLRREQLKVQSLEKNLEQKTKEVEDVTKLCDELIAKVQQH